MFLFRHSCAWKVPFHENLCSLSGDDVRKECVSWQSLGDYEVCPVSSQTYVTSLVRWDKSELGDSKCAPFTVLSVATWDTATRWVAGGLCNGKRYLLVGVLAKKIFVGWCPFKKDICWLVSFHKRYLLVGVLSKKIFVGWCPFKTTFSGSLDLQAWG